MTTTGRQLKWKKDHANLIAGPFVISPYYLVKGVFILTLNIGAVSYGSVGEPTTKEKLMAVAQKLADATAKNLLARGKRKKFKRCMLCGARYKNNGGDFCPKHVKELADDFKAHCATQEGNTAKCPDTVSRK